ncbi:HNH endonuclease signature motif containing protein [Paramicrobacterium chengjingii]|uniref:DUF222 domain-containing protein n=1 Tax=Paramicrobacterium chengjingii TaxID=2769067 RepID=A0ABX6YFL4_9MICO|nr:HNH endonuclease signature motif containing protein [Microbacterium chengjingii]QPZ37582.1 DUF222 domain-containing protein [Microbacterium chengjingii]
MVNFTEFVKPPGGDAPPPGSPGASAQLLSMMVDSVAEQQELISSMQARVFTMVCQTVRFALRNDRVFVHDTTASPASREEWTRRALIAELALTLHLSERKVASMVQTSETLMKELPETLSALHDGQISVQHAEIMVSQAEGLDSQQKREFESIAIQAALSTTPPQFRTAAAAIRERLNPDSAAERKHRAMENRHIEVAPLPDGMGCLSVFGPIEKIKGIEAAARNTARSLKAAGDDRTVSQITADAVLDATMTGFTVDVSSRDELRAAKIRPTVRVTVPVMTLLGRSDEPGTLEGYGPIDADTARELAADAPSFTRLLTHPETGTVLSVGRDSYAVPADLRRLVEIRDETCGFAGCNRPASQCDIDHRHDWQYGGETSSDNLQPLCTSHHPLKHESTWQVNRADDGTIVWTSPLGRQFMVRPNGEPGFKRIVKFEETEQATVLAAPERKQLPDNPPF